MPYILYAFLSVAIISIISLIGILTLSIKADKLKKMLLYLVSFAAGGLLGDAFIHLLPEAVEENGFGINMSIFVLAGVAVFFLLEKVIKWHHYHYPHTKEQVHPFAITNLIGDGFHNLIDGMIIGAAYIVNIPVGIATTVAVIFHEIPQEIGDFGVLLQGGYKIKKALLANFITALMAFVGVTITILLGQRSEEFIIFLVPFAAGGFIYVASADLIPELHKETNIKKSIIQFISLTAGIAVMFLLTFLE